MRLFLGSLSYAVAMTAVIPAALTRTSWSVRRPRSGLGVWFVAAGSSVIALLVAVVALISVIGHQTRPGHNLVAVELFGAWAGLLLLGCEIARISARVDIVTRAGSGSVDRLLDALACPTCTHEHFAAIEVHTIISTEVFALSSRGPGRPTIVLSSGLRSRLSDSETRSVIEHERAHLAQRHHLAIWAAAAQGAMLPWFPPARGLEQATRLLVELIADDIAVRRCGATAVAGALAKLSDPADGDSGRLRAERILALA